VNHLRLVMRTSMGGIHAWAGSRCPNFMDGLVPLASVPTEIGRNRMMRKMMIDAMAIQNGTKLQPSSRLNRRRCS